MMLVTNRGSVPSGVYDGFETSLLIGETNSGSGEISIQMTEVKPQGMQFLHSHKEEQCYYIIQGTGLMIVDSEEKQVTHGDAVYIPSGSNHGIKNIGKDLLIYLTANRAFGVKREKEIWPVAAIG